MNNPEKRNMERFSIQLNANLIKLSKDGEISQPPELNAPLELSTPLALSTNDICAGGAFFKTDSPLPVGSDVEVDLVLPFETLKALSSDQIRVRVTGAVLRSNAEGMAVVFDKGFEIIPIDDKKN